MRDIIPTVKITNHAGVKSVKDGMKANSYSLIDREKKPNLSDWAPSPEGNDTIFALPKAAPSLVVIFPFIRLALRKEIDKAIIEKVFKTKCEGHYLELLFTSLAPPHFFS